MGTRILIVDDEQDTLNLLRTILMISGFDPITTLNSVEAIGLAEREKPDVVLLDIMMPRLDGFTLCKLMRRREATMHIPIIFVTAYESLDLEERRVEAGGNMVVRKPIDFDVLVQAIDQILKARPAPTTSPAPSVPTAAASPAAQTPASAADTQERVQAPASPLVTGATETQEHEQTNTTPADKQP